MLPLSYAVDAMQHLDPTSASTAEVWADLAVVAGFALGGLALGAATLRRRTPDRRPDARSLGRMALLRQPLLLLSRSDRVKKLVSTMPVSAGSSAATCPARPPRRPSTRPRARVADGLQVTLDFLGEDTLDVEQADATVAAYVDLLEQLAARGLTRNAEVSVKLSAIGQALPGQRASKIALENARTICRAARNAGTTVTLDMEDHTTTDSTLAILRELRKDFPETGAVLQAYLHRTEADCRALAYEGSRVRLCKGAYNEPEDGRLPGRRSTSTSPTSAASRCCWPGRATR